MGALNGSQMESIPKRPFRVSAMAYSRQRWNDTFRNRLTGLLREHTKSFLVNRLGLKNYWDQETKGLAKKAEEMLNPTITKKKGTWSFYSVAAESFLEAAGDQYKCKEALGDFKHYDLYSDAEIAQVYQSYTKNTPDSEDILLEAMEKYFSKTNFDGIIKALQKKL